MARSVEDRLAIAELISMHGHLFDHGELDRLDELFTADVVYDITDFGQEPLRGTAAIREAALALGAGNPVGHHVTNTAVTQVVGDQVHARSKGLGVKADGTTGSVTYEDILVNGDRGWRISHRKVLARRTQVDVRPPRGSWSGRGAGRVAPGRAGFPRVESTVMYPVHRTGERISLRELRSGDVDAVFAVFGDPVATEHLAFEPLTPDQVRMLLTHIMASAMAEPRSEYFLGVTSGGDLVGTARLALDPHQPLGATMGFTLRPDHWRKGLGTAIVRALLAFAFDDLGLHRVWGARSPANTASAHVMERAGMVEEGCIREHVLKGGAWRDSIVHAILEHEWAP